MKKLCLLLALMLLLPVIPAMAEARGGGDFTYVLLDDGTAEITGWSGGATDLEIPEALDGHAVSALGDYAVSYWDELTRVTVPDGVTRLGEGVFEGCTSLAFVRLPGNIEFAGANPFGDCFALADIEIEGDRYRFEGGMLIDAQQDKLICFLDAGAESCAVPGGIREIGAGAFSGFEGLGRVALPDGLEAIGDFAFEGCDALEAIDLPDTLSSIGDAAFCYCTSLTSIDLPAGITEIGAGTFEGCIRLAGIGLPGNLKTIGEAAFYGCESLGEIALPEGLEEIGEGAFTFCMGLREVVLPASLARMGANPFMDCEALVNIRVAEGHPTMVVKDGVLFDDGGARLVCYPKALGARSYAIPEGTARVDAFAFYYCTELVSVIVPESVKDIDPYAFEGHENLTLTVERGSYAEAFARGNGLKLTYPGADDWLGG